MRRRIVWLVVGVLAAAVVGTVAFAYLTVPQPRINPGQYYQIREGMTLAEVNGIIGGPPGDYDPGSWGTGSWGIRVRVLAGSDDFGSNANLQQKYWSGREYEIGVLLDENGIVVDKQLTEIASTPRQTWLDYVRKMLGW